MSLGEEYQELRRVWVDNILTEALEEKDNATENFLPRARIQRGKLQPCMLKEKTSNGMAVIGYTLIQATVCLPIVG